MANNSTVKKQTGSSKNTTKKPKVSKISYESAFEDLNAYYSQVSDAIDFVEKESAFSKLFYDSYLAGNRSVYQKDIVETKIFDEEWIKTLESYFPAIERIMNNPRSNLKYEEEIVVVEKARKVNSLSVKHLASHTQLLKNVKQNGDVVPKKILTTYSEQDYAIYENRFVKTLVDRLYIFISNRYNVIKENVESFNKNHLNIKSDFGINNTEVSLNVDVVVKKSILDKDAQRNAELLKRVDYLNKMALSFKNSPLYREIHNAPKVNPPIMKTNIIMKNVDFNGCYMLWLFLDKYNALLFDLQVKEKSTKLTPEVEEGFNRIAMLAYLSAENNNPKLKQEFEEKKLLKKSTKRVNSHIDDLTERPDLLNVEDNTINEYYLNQYKNLFKKSYNDYKKNSSSDLVALKQAIRQFNNLSNTLYENMFELESGRANAVIRS